MLSKTSSFRLKIEVPEAKEKKSKYLVNIGWCSKMMERSDYRKLGNNNSMLFYKKKKEYRSELPFSTPGNIFLTQG